MVFPGASTLHPNNWLVQKLLLLSIIAAQMGKYYTV